MGFKSRLLDRMFSFADIELKVFQSELSSTDEERQNMLNKSKHTPREHNRHCQFINFRTGEMLSMHKYSIIINSENNLTNYDNTQQMTASLLKKDLQISFEPFKMIYVV